MATEYSIRIHIPNGEGEAADTPPIATQSSEAVRETKTPQTANRNVGRYIAARTIEPMINAAATAVISNVGAYSGSVQMQQRVDLAMKGVQLATSTVSNVAGAMAMIGGPVGIGVGLAISALGVAISYTQKEIQMNINRIAEDQQRAMMKARLTGSYNGSRGG